MINKDFESLAQNLKYKNENLLDSTSYWIGSRETELLSIINDISSSERVNRQRALLSEEQFRDMVLHECARCNRNAHQFSLIQVDLPNEPEKRIKTRLVKKVLKRIRETDEAGWLNSSSLGIFLPETNREGARVCATDVCDGLVYQIYTYPDLMESKDDEQPGEDNENKFCDPKQDESRSENSQGEGIDAADQLTSMPRAAITQEVETVVHPRSLPSWKRIIDIIGSLLTLLIVSPIFLAVAVYIKIVSPGPVFYRQERIGYLGHPFTMWKFRTMKADADSNVHKHHLKDLINGDKVMIKLDNERDYRWIPLAGILRKTCVDELPQLFNVLRGEMSLVGPRPVLSYEAEEFTIWQRKRFQSLPGMTGLWQVSGKNRLTFNQMMRLDARYSRRFNFFMDLMIFVKTVPAILGQTLDSVRTRLPSHSMKKSVSVWRRSLNDLVRQVFL